MFPGHHRSYKISLTPLFLLVILLGIEFLVGEAILSASCRASIRHKKRGFAPKWGERRFENGC